MFRDAAEAIKRLETAVIPSSDPAKRVLTIRQPRGVYGILTPWNFPVAIPSEYLSAGLASGNAMVWKPSEWTPISAVAPDELLPRRRGSRRRPQPRPRRPGGGRRRGGRPPRHRRHRPHRLQPDRPRRRPAGSRQADAAGAGRQRTDDHLRGRRSWSKAVARTAFGCFANAGQICDSTERILVAAAVHDELIAGLVARAEEVRLGTAVRRRHDDGPGRQRAHGVEGRPAPRGRHRQGRHRADRRDSCGGLPHPPLLPPDGGRRGHSRDARPRGGDVRAGGGGRHLRRRGRGAAVGERGAARPGGKRVHPRPRPGGPRRRGACSAAS